MFEDDGDSVSNSSNEEEDFFLKISLKHENINYLDGLL